MLFLPCHVAPHCLHQRVEPLRERGIFGVLVRERRQGPFPLGVVCQLLLGDCFAAGEVRAYDGAQKLPLQCRVPQKSRPRPRHA